MNYYIGLDAHSQTCTAVVVNENGDQKLREKFETTEANLVVFVNKVKGDNVSLTFEECTLSQWLYLTLVEHVDHLLVCNPVYVAKKQSAKTDYRDALHLALVSDIVSAKNRLKAVFRSEAVDTNTKNFYEDRDRIQELQKKRMRSLWRQVYTNK